VEEGGRESDGCVAWVVRCEPDAATHNSFLSSWVRGKFGDVGADQGSWWVRVREALCRALRHDVQGCKDVEAIH